MEILLQYRFLFGSIYFAIGALYSLLALYLERIGFSGTQIGLIMSSGSLMLIFSQPFWGIVCDKTRKTVLVLKVSLIAAGVLALSLPFVRGYLLFLILYAAVHFFQGANAPISDTLGITAANRLGLTFGDFRQYGAIGFAIAVFTVSNISEVVGLWIIFPFYFLAYLVAAILFRQEEPEITDMHVPLIPGLKQLIILPRYRLILAATFFIFGPVVANNNYYGLLFEFTGGTIAGIGLAFLLFSGSEAPFMKLSGKMIARLGLINTMMMATSISAVRWFWYSTGPEPKWMLIFFVIQGLSVGLYIVSGAQFVSENALPHLKTTAMTLYASAGIGMGGIFCQFTGGILLDLYNILAVYFFFGVSTIIGFLILCYLRYHARREG
ncbi:MFS transporter [Anoxynatronum buryatiense]|uniref:MFS transporter, PPP family, 3-phenylpropionic acid transporter n=1 Tax=Anoxynatronum buryatiense TaxID=489973 RepID=A0AA46AHC7_9CLOT|nr:MFS transporter [Anoxynatronum buryatiense]SMP38066.1 MFS transporter, PPP family, 3-phenylpropionic acid transporter [Anoxynatronum buryatiense]